MMRMCGIGLTEVNTIDTSDVELKFNNRDRITAALRSLIDKSNLPLTLLVKEYGSIFMASKFDLGHTTVIKHEIRTTVHQFLQLLDSSPCILKTRLIN